MGMTCEGNAFFLQLGEKVGFGMAWPGMKRMFNFIAEQQTKMQQCRASESSARTLFERLVDEPKRSLSAQFIQSERSAHFFERSTL